VKLITTRLAAFTFSFSVLVLNCFVTFSQQRIFATIAGGDLYSFNLTNCTRHFIGSTGQGFGDIAFTPDGRLWGIVGGQLYKIDTATANVTLVGNTGIGAVSLVDLNDSILLAEFGMKLYGINNNNATSYYIGNIGYQAAGDLTWYDNDLYMTTSAQLIKMVLNNTNTAILSVDTVNSLSNPIPICEGAATASFVGDYNSIIGFNGPNIYKICQINGSYSMLCPSLNIGGTPGAASIRLATQDPQPTTCNIPNSVVNNTSLKTGFEVFPNPATTLLTITTTTTQPAEIILYDIASRKMMQEKFIGSATLNIENLAKGVYLYEVKSENGVVKRGKVMKE
jgi:hypothetical protein